MAALPHERDGSRAGAGSGGGSRAGDAEGDLLDSRIPEFSKLSAPAAVSGAPVDADDEEAAAASVYGKRCVVICSVSMAPEASNFMVRR